MFALSTLSRSCPVTAVTKSICQADHLRILYICKSVFIEYENFYVDHNDDEVIYHHE